MPQKSVYHSGSSFINYSRPDRINNLSPSSNDAASFRSGHNCPQGDCHLGLVLLHVRHPGEISLNSEKEETSSTFVTVPTLVHNIHQLLWWLYFTLSSETILYVGGFGLKFLWLAAVAKIFLRQIAHQTVQTLTTYYMQALRYIIWDLRLKLSNCQIVLKARAEWFMSHFVPWFQNSFCFCFTYNHSFRVVIWDFEK